MKLSEIYKESFRVVRKHKILWVFGMVVTALSGSSAAGSLNSFGRGGSNFSNFNQSSVSADFKNLESGIQPVLKIIGSFFQAIPITTWIIFGLGILIAVAFGVIFTIFLRSWAVGSLIGGTYDALDDRNEISFASVGYRGRKSFLSLAALNFFPSFIVALIFGALLAAGLVLVTAGQSIVGGLIIALAVIIFLVAIIIICAAEIWAERLIAIDHLPWAKAFSQGLTMFKNHFADTVKLGCTNLLLGCGTGCLIMAVTLPILGVLFVIGIIPIIGWALIPVLILVAIAILIASGLASAVVLTFKYVTWSAFYKQIREEPHA